MKDLLSEKFNMHYENAQRFCNEKNFIKARESFLFAAEAMLLLAKESKGNLKTARVERAKSLMDIADKICPQEKTEIQKDYMVKNRLPDYMNKFDFSEIFNKKTIGETINKPEQNLKDRKAHV